MGMANKIINKLGINLPEKYQWVGSAILGVLSVIVLTFLMWLVMFISRAAHAEETGWLTSAQTFLYLERAQNDRTSFCRNTRDDLTSNLGADVTIYRWNENVSWHARLTHHSCAFGPDAPDYNAIGSGIVFRFDR